MKAPHHPMAIGRGAGRGAGSAGWSVGRDWTSNLGMELLLIMLMGISVYNGIYLLYNIMKHYVTMVVEPLKVAM